MNAWLYPLSKENKVYEETIEIYSWFMFLCKDSNVACVTADCLMSLIDEDDWRCIIIFQST